MTPLFCQRFPDLALSQTIAELPTPVRPLDALGSNAWVKCDDLSHPQYGGNKIRKLDWIAADIQQQNKHHVISFGAIGTNAGVATAMMCQRLGLRCTLYLFDQPDSDTVRANLQRMQYYGAELIYCGSLWQTMLRFYLSPHRLRRDSYFLWAGCSNPPAILAYVDAAFELKQQIDQGIMPVPEKIVLPVGSGSTAAGMYLGIQLSGLPSELIAVRVAPAKLGPFDACSDAIVNNMIRQGASLLGLSQQSLPTSSLNHQYYGDGYGCADEQVYRAIARFAEAGVTLEGTYSGKAACAFLDQLTTAQQPVLFWNTFNSSDFLSQVNDPATLLASLPSRLRRRLSAEGKDQQTASAAPQ